MKKLALILPLIGCSTLPTRSDTMSDNGTSPTILSADTVSTVDAGTDGSLQDGSSDGSDGAVDIAACYNNFWNNCMPPCLALPNHTPERTACISKCEFNYRVCTGCYNVPNE